MMMMVMFYGHRQERGRMWDDVDGQEVGGGGGADDPWRETAETTVENATEMRNSMYKWNGPLHAAVAAGLDATNLDVVKVVTIVSYLLTFVVGSGAV